MNGKLTYAMLAGLVSIGIWAGTLQATVNQQARWIESNATVVSRLAVLESQQIDIKRVLDRIERRLDGNWRERGPAQ
jgi:hypothetical protein